MFKLLIAYSISHIFRVLDNKKTTNNKNIVNAPATNIFCWCMSQRLKYLRNKIMMPRMETNEQNNRIILTPVSHVNTFYFYSCSSTEKKVIATGSKRKFSWNIPCGNWTHRNSFDLQFLIDLTDRRQRQLLRINLT